MYQKIRYFLKAAETGSFSTAAQEMFISPQAMTKQINALEAELGGKLFNRSPQGVTLTRFGQFTQQKFAPITQDFEQIIDEVKDYIRNDKVRVTIGIFSALPREELVSPIVSFLLASYPDYQISLEMIELEEGRKKLMDGKLDLLLTNVHEQDNLFGYDCLSFAEHETKVVVSLTHPWVMKDAITVEDMKQETFLKMEMDNEHYLVPSKDNFYLNIPCKNVRPVKNFDTMLILLRQGAGFGVFPMAFLDMDRAHVKCFDYPGKTLIYHTSLVYNKNNPLQGLKRIVSDLKEEFDLEPV